jgi:hypothetical protein
MIWERRGEGKGIGPLVIDVNDPPKFETEDYKERARKDRATNKGTDKESRKILKIEDVRSADTPYTDTARWSEKGIRWSGKSDGIDWQPGRLLSNDSNERAAISHDTFMFSHELPSGLPVANFCSHFRSSHDRPKLVLNWGPMTMFVSGNRQVSK